jgi:RNA polymerase sigma-70 factor (ECF subfamily)
VAADVFEPLQRFLRRRATTDDAADIFGDAMLTIWRRLDDVPDDDPLPWCYGVARRCLANQRRSAGRRLRLVEKATGAHIPPHDQDPQASIDDLDPELAAALGVLTTAEAEIVRLWAWEALEPAEIATVIDSTANAVSVALSRARRKLRAELQTSRQDQADAGQEPDEPTITTERSER